MVWRWVIHGVFIFLILLCAGGWVESYGHVDYFGWCRDRYAYDISSRAGSMTLLYSVTLAYITDARDPVGWRWDRAPIMPENRSLFRQDPRVFCGFGYGHAEGALSDERWVAVPYYFLILVFSGVLLIVWRKTRPRKVGGAFPVEVKPGGG